LSDRDLELKRRMLGGDEQAFDEFFGAYFPGLYRFAMARLRYDADAAEEIAQATLCAAISKLETFRGEASFFTWLCTFCRHEISAFYERSRKHPVALDLTEESPEVLAALESLSAAAGDDPEQSLGRSDVARLVHVTLDRLPERYADALEWKYIEGISVIDIAGRLGVTGKAAESLLTRAREAFRDGFSTLTRGHSAWKPGAPEASRT
jgi:RNA polymerase sigma-70 factor (ECF subfamily)